MTVERLKWKNGPISIGRNLKTFEPGMYIIIGTHGQTVVRILFKERKAPRCGSSLYCTCRQSELEISNLDSIQEWAGVGEILCHYGPIKFPDHIKGIKSNVS